MPAWLIGWIVGDAAGRIAFSKPFLTVALWCGVCALGFWLGEANLGRAAGTWTALAAPAALLAWTLWHPARNGAKVWLVDGIYLWLRLGVVILVGWAAWLLFEAQGRVGPWLVQAWPMAVGCGGLWIVQKLLVAWMIRSHRLAGAGSRLHDD